MVLVGGVNDPYLRGLGVPEVVDLFLLLLFLDFLVGSVEELKLGLSVWLEFWVVKKDSDVLDHLFGLAVMEDSLNTSHKLVLS